MSFIQLIHEMLSCVLLQNKALILLLKWMQLIQCLCCRHVLHIYWKLETCTLMCSYSIFCILFIYLIIQTKVEVVTVELTPGLCFHCLCCSKMSVFNSNLKLSFCFLHQINQWLLYLLVLTLIVLFFGQRGQETTSNCAVYVIFCR